MVKTYSISDLFITAWQDDHKNPTLRPQEMARVIELRYNLDKAIADHDDVRFGFYAIALLRILRKNKSAVAKITEEQVVDCIHDLTFIREPWYFFPASGNTMFVAPDEYMHDRTIEQFAYADSAFTKYLKMEEQFRMAHPPVDGNYMSIATLNEFIAILYTPADQFQPKDIGARGKLVAGLSESVKALVFHTYANIREYAMKRCPTLFPKSESKGPAEVVYTGKMWRDLLFDFSETEAFKGYDQARNASMYDALDYLEKKTHEAQQQKDKKHA